MMDQFIFEFSNYKMPNQLFILILSVLGLNSKVNFYKKIHEKMLEAKLFMYFLIKMDFRIC